MFTIISAFDDRARPKGSRDPLGIEAIWSFMGRKVVGNLTTVTSSLDNFIVALLCCKYAHESAKDLPGIQEHFMRAEQLAAYLKLAEGEGYFFGVTQAKKNFDTSKITFGAAQKHQLLSAQLSYGLWGLYSTAMEGAGLITAAQRSLTDSGNQLCELIIAKLTPSNWKQFTALAQRSNVVATSELAELAPKFIDMMRDKALKKTVVDALLATQRNCALQSELYRHTQQFLSNEAATAEVAPFCAYMLGSNGVSAELKTAFTRIGEMEPVLVVIDTIMSWLQGQGDQTLEAIQKSLTPALSGLACKNSWLQEAQLPHRQFLETFFTAINAGNAADAIAAILGQNKTLMQQRGGAAWVELDSKKTLTVRVRNDKSQLPENLAETSQVWKNTYFLNSFLQVTRQALL